MPPLLGEVGQVDGAALQQLEVGLLPQLRGARGVLQTRNQKWMGLDGTPEQRACTLEEILGSVFIA